MAEEGDVSDIKVGKFHRDLQFALRKFLEYEDEHGSAKANPAVRAARFNQYVLKHFSHIRDNVSPDICEKYLEHFKYIELPLDRGPDEPLTEAERYTKAALIYGQFKKDVGFKGSAVAEAMAFTDYAFAKYPHSLPEFTEEEASATITRSKLKKGGMMFGAAVSLALAIGMGVSALRGQEKESEAPERAPDHHRRYEADEGARSVPSVVPNYGPGFAPGMGPFFPGAGPGLMPAPPTWAMPDSRQWQERVSDPLLREQMERNAKKRLEAGGNDKPYDGSSFQRR